MAHPTVTFVRDELTLVQLAGTASLPNEVRRTLELSADGCEPIHYQDDDLEGAVSLPDFHQSYRSSATPESDIESLARSMLACVLLPPQSRALRQRLEYREVRVWRLRLEHAETIYAYGTPPKVFPQLALATFLGRLFGG